MGASEVEDQAAGGGGIVLKQEWGAKGVCQALLNLTLFLDSTIFQLIRNPATMASEIAVHPWMIHCSS